MLQTSDIANWGIVAKKPRNSDFVNIDFIRDYNCFVES
jgi:hypothetical protein